MLYIIAYVAGILTIVSPCILPILPFVFARSDRPFRSSGLPVLLGLAISFVFIGALASAAGEWAVTTNRYGRIAATLLLTLFGLALIFPSLSQRLAAPAVALGNRLSQRSADGQGGFGLSLVLGLATGLLWAPCAGPILGIILTGAALKGFSGATAALLLAYALGAATSLALAILAGGKVFAAMKRSLGAGEWIRRGLGVAVLIGVGAIAMGLDTGVLARLSATNTAAIEEKLLNAGGIETPSSNADAIPASGPLKDLGPMPSLAGTGPWLNSPPITNRQLEGKVVLFDFWTYSCINCIRTIPYVRDWQRKYAPHGLVIIGIHAPEFAFEKDVDNVRRAVASHEVTWPVVLDNDERLWKAFDNHYWPSHYFVDGKGRIRANLHGESTHAAAEALIRRMLLENGAQGLPPLSETMVTKGVEADSDSSIVGTPETYLGYGRTENYAGKPAIVQDAPAGYSYAALAPNQWALSGTWIVEKQHARLTSSKGKVGINFNARDLHLVMGSSKPVAIRVTIDGKPPGKDAGVDIAADGTGTISDQRLYNLVRQKSDITGRRVDIEFLGAGADIFAFTFG